MASKTDRFKTSIDIPAGTRSEMIDLCNQQLADTADLKSQIKQAHWNVKGAEFIALHKLYDDLAAEVEVYVDVIAERVTQLGRLRHGHRAHGCGQLSACRSSPLTPPTDWTP